MQDYAFQLTFFSLQIFNDTFLKLCSSHSRTEEALRTQAVSCELHHYLKLYHDPQFPTEFNNPYTYIFKKLFRFYTAYFIFYISTSKENNDCKQGASLILFYFNSLYVPLQDFCIVVP